MLINKKNHSIIFFFVIIIFFFFINKSFSIEPSVFIQSTVNRASKALSNNSSKEEKIQELKNIAKETVDIKGVGYYALGNHKKELSSDQIKEYLFLFEQYFLKTFSSRLAQYTNPEVQVESSEKLSKNYTIVSSKLIATEQRPEVHIKWRVYTKDPQNILIRDLMIEGLSLARTQKEEFNSIIQSNDGNINALFSSLKKFINN